MKNTPKVGLISNFRGAVQSGEFTPEGVSEEQACALFQGFYEDGLKALAQSLATRNA